MFRVLHVMRSLNAGGIGTFIMNVYRTIDCKTVQFDFAVTNKGMGEYGQEILDLGGHIFFISENGNASISDDIKQLVNLYKLCYKGKYDAIHCHYYFANAEFLLVAKMAGIKKRVSHCHNTRTKKIGIVRKIFELISRRLLFFVATDFLGCSEAAARFLYGNKAVDTGVAKVLYNGIDYNRWNLDKFNVETLKEKWGIVNKNVIIFVGRFEQQKNPLFALRVFNEVKNSILNSIFIMVGYGSLSNDIKKLINELHLENYIKLLPPNSNITELQAIADIMLAPSLWEGLSIAFIEAQKMKTMVFASDYVPTEVNMGFCEFLPLKLNEWDIEIEKYFNNLNNRKKIFNTTKYELFNVNNTAKNLLEVYGVQ